MALKCGSFLAGILKTCACLSVATAPTNELDVHEGDALRFDRPAYERLVGVVQKSFKGNLLACISPDWKRITILSDRSSIQNSLDDRCPDESVGVQFFLGEEQSSIFFYNYSSMWHGRFSQAIQFNPSNGAYPDMRVMIHKGMDVDPKNPVSMDFGVYETFLYLISQYSALNIASDSSGIAQL